MGNVASNPCANEAYRQSQWNQNEAQRQAAEAAARAQQCADARNQAFHQGYYHGGGIYDGARQWAHENFHNPVCNNGQPSPQCPNYGAPRR